MSRLAAIIRSQKFRLAIECCALFVGVPIAYTVGCSPVTIIPLLILMAAGCWWWLRRQHKSVLRDSLRKKASVLEWCRIFVTYAAAIPCLMCVLWLAKPAALFSLVNQQPKMWLLVMFAYPLVSVLPQELIYRVYFFERYRPLFGHGVGMLAANAAAFSFGHIVFRNWPAVALTLLGGWLFARTYQRTSSLRLVAIEHALYGWAIFTIGYGEFFLEGTLRLFRP